jgi:hypothetical protein
MLAARAKVLTLIHPVKIEELPAAAGRDSRASVGRAGAAPVRGVGLL